MDIWLSITLISPKEMTPYYYYNCFFILVLVVFLFLIVFNSHLLFLSKSNINEAYVTSDDC